MKIAVVVGVGRGGGSSDVVVDGEQVLGDYRPGVADDLVIQFGGELDLVGVFGESYRGGRPSRLGGER